MNTPYRGFMYTERRSALAFWFGSLIVSIGVLLHLPMFWMARDMGFMLAGMPMDPEMYLGMALIVAGIAAAGYGLLPKELADRRHPLPETLGPAGRCAADPRPLAGDGGARGRADHRHHEAGEPRLRFTPGMRTEYGLGKAMVSLLPFLGALGDHGRVVRVGRARRSLRPPRLDHAVLGDVRGDVDLRRHAVLLVERGHVLPDGRRGGRHAAGRLCAPGGADADQASRLVASS